VELGVAARVVSGFGVNSCSSCCAASAVTLDCQRELLTMALSSSTVNGGTARVIGPILGTADVYSVTVTANPFGRDALAVHICPAIFGSLGS
jgi:hypothetical protein